MASAPHYHFTADIHFKYASACAVMEMYDACTKIFFDKQSKRRSNKYWTKCNVTHYEDRNPLTYKVLLRFEIEDAETVRELKSIEEQIRNICSEKPYRKLITSIECRHVRTR